MLFDTQQYRIFQMVIVVVAALEMIGWIIYIISKSVKMMIVAVVVVVVAIPIRRTSLVISSMKITSCRT